jgi:hypothetical protein
MKSKFIGTDKIVLYNLYSREDVGFKGTQLSGMRISENKEDENKRIVFVNLSDKYDNRLTKSGLISEPRLEYHILSKPQAVVYYLFLCHGNKGGYYYVGASNYQAGYDNTHNMIDFNASEIPVNIVKELGCFQPLP